MTNKLALVVAVVLGVLSILGVRFYVEKIKDSYEKKVGLVDIPVAGRDLKKGDTVQKADIQITQFPHAVVDALGGSHYPASETDKIENGKVVVEQIKQGQVFQQYHFAIMSRKIRFPDIGPEWRAFTIKVQPEQALSGLLRPGDKVDVVVTEHYEGASGGPLPTGRQKFVVTSTLAQKIEVLAIDGYVDAAVNYSEYQYVTLKMHPEDINRLAYVVDNKWEYHLSKMDDTASTLVSVNPVFADNEYEHSKSEIDDWFRKKIKDRVNQGPPK